MTDTSTQQTQWQGQQWYTDDILEWEDIFAAIPRANQEQEKVADVAPLEKKYELEPLPETIEKIMPPPMSMPPIPVQETQVQPVSTFVVPAAIGASEVKIVSPATPRSIPTPPAPVQKVSIPEKIAPVVEKKIEKTSEIVVQPVSTFVPPPAPIVQAPKETVVEIDKKFQTDVQKKFAELFTTTKKIYELKDKTGIQDETFDILWADNDKIFVSYRFLLDETNDPMLFITKIEQDKETEEETKNELRFTFNEEMSSLEVVVNDALLFDEIQDFTADQKKKLQVIDKINKFTFLASEEVRKLEKEIKEKEEAERERRKLQEIFRNF